MKFTTLLGALLCSFLSNAQEWVNYYGNDKISVDVAVINYNNLNDGINHERIVFKFQNHSAEKITFSFLRKTSYAQDGSLSPNQDQSYSIVLEPNEIEQYDTENNRNKLFYIFKSDLNGTIKRSLSNFELSNFQTIQ